MRPVRLLLDGFGSYRQPAEADFSDVDFFALTGPTGSSVSGSSMTGSEGNARRKSGGCKSSSAVRRW